ncbi:MAG: HD domain-containing protein [Endomicrobia bacterium]|nr:HD domain-containing protein [Endomicrobiia bacterium]MDW8055092.1 HD domain-containing protein [Elusimicrobiota bacterium]
MRLSDILKKKYQQQETEVKQEVQLQKKEKEIVSEPATSAREEKTLKSYNVEEVYAKAINTVRNLFRNINSSKTSILVDDVLEVTRSITEIVDVNNQDILLYSCYSTIDSYIYAHSVNVAIYSGVIGKAKGLPIEDLQELVLCGILHDIGMAKVLHIAEKKQKITEPEFEDIKNHSEYAKEEIGKLQLPAQLKSKLISVISQIHERMDGSGYLKGLEAEQIEFFAKIISIADIYEAMTHPRPYRDRILPHDAVVALVKQAQTELDSQLTKLFIDKISIFPVGSYVKLNTGEIARVIATNSSFPLRPKVKVILTAEKYAPKGEEIIDLSQNSQIVITEPVDETKIDTMDKKLLLQIRAQRWWVKDSGV